MLIFRSTPSLPCICLTLCAPAAATAAAVCLAAGAMQVVYDCGPVQQHAWPDFDALRQRVACEWEALPPNADVISASLKAKVQRVLQSTRGGLDAAERQQAAAAAAAGSGGGGDR